MYAIRSYYGNAATWRQIWGILLDTLAIFYRLHILHYYDTKHTTTPTPSDVEKIEPKNA